MLFAIGIFSFQKNTSLKFIKINSAQANNGLSFFSGNLLDSLENHTLPILTTEDLLSAKPLHFFQDNEHHYIKRVSGEPIILVISSRSKLDDTEAHYLFTNMLHAHKRSVTAKVTLQQIVDNPLGYTGSDRNIEFLKQSLEDTKKIMLDNIDTIIERGEKLERVTEATIRLEKATAAFEEKAKKLNNCGCSSSF